MFALVRFPTPQRAASQSPVPTVVREGEGTGLPQKRAPPYHTARQSVHGASQHCRIKISVSSDHVARSPRRQRLSGPCSTLRGASMLKPCLAAHAVLVDPKRVRSHHNGGSPHSWSFRGGGSCRSDPLPLISTAPLGRGLRATARGATRMGMQQQASISAHHLPRSTSLWVGTGAASAQHHQSRPSSSGLVLCAIRPSSSHDHLALLTAGRAVGHPLRPPTRRPWCRPPRRAWQASCVARRCYPLGWAARAPV